MSDNQWAYWQSALAGNPNRDLIQKGNPQSGYYRDKNRAVGIWRNADGSIKWTVTSGYRPATVDELDENLFGFIVNRPITYEEFRRVLEGGKFSDHVDMPDLTPGIGHNAAPLHEVIAEQIEAKRAEARAWLESIGGEIATKEHAEKIGNYANVFSQMEKKAEEQRKAEKQPLDEQVKAVQERWGPVTKAADEAKRYAKKLYEAFGQKELARQREEEARRRAELQRQQEEAARLAQDRGEAPPPPPVELALPPAKPKASVGGGKIAMRTRKVVVVTDPRALLEHFARLDPPPVELVELASKIGKKAAEAGLSVPGLELKEETYAA